MWLHNRKDERDYSHHITIIVGDTISEEGLVDFEKPHESTSIPVPTLSSYIEEEKQKGEEGFAQYEVCLCSDPSNLDVSIDWRIPSVEGIPCYRNYSIWRGLFALFALHVHVYMLRCFSLHPTCFLNLCHPYIIST